MAAPSLNSPNIVNTEHRGWKLQARWFHSFWKASEGWVCYVTSPESSHKLNIGRWNSSDLALEHGRAYIDRRHNATRMGAARPPTNSRRQDLAR
jgi:hypothetical protein